MTLSDSGKDAVRFGSSWQMSAFGIARAIQANPRRVVNLVASAASLTSDFERISEARTHCSEVSNDP